MASTRYNFSVAIIAVPGKLWLRSERARIWAEAGALAGFGLMFGALFLPFVSVDCPGGCTSPALAPVSLAAGADNLWLILAVVLAFGAGSLVRILTTQRQWVAAVNLALSLTAVVLAIFEGVEAGTRVLHVELINLFTPTVLLAGYFLFLGGAALAAASTSLLLIIPPERPRARA